jgi:cell division septum initiation protein DivIVA
MDMLDRLDELSDIIETAKSLPLSASCVVPRDAVLDLLDEIRATLPDALRDAEQIVRRRDEILAGAEHAALERVADAEARAGHIVSEAADTAQARRSQATGEAESILAEARMQAALLIDTHTTTVAAKDEAARIFADAKQRAEVMLSTTTHRVNVLLSKAESALHAAAGEVSREHMDLEAVASAYLADIEPKMRPSVVDVAAREHRVTHTSGVDDFYDFELDVTGNHGQPPPGFG